MPVYVAVPLQADKSLLSAAVELKFPEPADRYKLQADSGWLINFPGTTVELSNLLGITGQPQGQPSPLGSAMVIPVSGYFGRGPTDMWEWLKTRLEA
jgi:hypothetical protein